MKRTLCMLAFASGLLTGCQHSLPSTSAHTDNEPPLLSVVPVQQRMLRSQLRLPAEMQAWQSVRLVPRIDGFVGEIRVDRGSRVKAGALLARLSAPEQVARQSAAKLQWQRAQAEIHAAQAKLATDNMTWNSLKRAASTPGAIAADELVAAEKQVDADQAKVTALRHDAAALAENYRAQQTLTQYLDVRAPFSGIIDDLNAFPGALVGPSHGPLFTLVDVAHLRLVVAVPEADADSIPIGAKVMFEVPALPGRAFSGSVARLAPALDPATRTRAVELNVVNTRDNLLAPGMYAQVDWPVHRGHPSLAVPATAIVRSSTGTFLVQISHGHAQWVPVQTGVIDGNDVEVFGNLHRGDMVANQSVDQIQPGQAVRAQLASH